MFILIRSTKYFILSFTVIIFSFGNLSANTKIWAGLANDGNWSSALNWDGGTLPITTDDVLLDNSFVVTNYNVMLPNTAVTVKSITISPLTSQSIVLILPSANVADPALVVNGPGYGITINKGGVFQNSSGLTSSSSLNVSDSIKITNGGRYIHNTRSMHASNIVQILSRAPGTETGIFEFDVPGTQAYTISISKRTYGTLILSAVSNGTKTYTGAGSNPLTINGDLQIGVGVTFKSDLATNKGIVNLNGNLIQQGGILNLASGPDSTVWRIKGDVIQSAGSVITESSTGIPIIELAGSVQQNISFQGAITDSVIFKINNAAGTVLQAPLSLPYVLNLVNGNITTSAQNLLTLQAKAVVLVDSSISNTSFINGPLRKEGLLSTNNFLFPVGKTNEFRWLELKTATGNFIIEFISASAKDLSTSYGLGINHISSHGYWTISPDANPAASAKVELSFANASSSGVTDMATLRAAQLVSGIWINRDNTSTTGTPGASGSVVSENIVFGSTTNNFVLASSVPNENPLPVILISFIAAKENNEIKLNWDVASTDDVDYFEVWSSDDDNNFIKLDMVKSVLNETDYEFKDKQILNGTRYYKLRIVEKDGNIFFSKIIYIRNDDNAFRVLSIAPSPVYDNTTILLYAKEKVQLQFVVTGLDGKIVTRKIRTVIEGKNSIPCNFSALPSGVYILSCFDSKGNIGVVKFVKL